MEKRRETQPIVKAKPVRGREMQSTRIPKDIVDTARAETEGESKVEDLQKPREGDAETYHEGYIDGKLYLVPDTNLQAMRDIVNLRMRRRHSSAEKPQTSLDEPTQYSEFKSKLDGLLEKIDQLDDTSEDDVSHESLFRGVKRKKQKALPENKTPRSTLSSTESRRKPDVPSVRDRTEAPHKRATVPPMLDENIKYIRVRQKPDESGLQPQKSRGKDNTENQLDDLPKSLSSESFKLLISGHLKNGMNPVFIAHQNYKGINVLANQTPDFKTHKKDGNIDIFITGKFFTENILKEETSESPALLDIKPNKIVIDKENALYRKNFKDIYKMGHLEVVLEGEFKKDHKTLKYTPVFSLNIIKNSSLEEYTYLGNQSPTTVLRTEQNDETPFANKNQKTEKAESTKSVHKHVHYAGEDDKELCEDVPSREKPVAKDNTLFGRIKKNKLYKIMFLKKDDSVTRGSSLDDVAAESSSQQMKARPSKNKREELARLRKSRLRARKARRGQIRKLYNKSEGFDSSKLQDNIQVYQVNQELQSPFDQNGSLVDKESADITQENTTHKKVKKVKKVKEDKNQAIVENPILAQMQQFFIA